MRHIFRLWGYRSEQSLPLAGQHPGWGDNEQNKQVDVIVCQMAVSAKEKNKARRRNREYSGGESVAVINRVGKVEFTEKMMLDTILIKT